MRPGLKLVAIVVVLAAFGGLTLWRQRAADRADADQQELTAATAAFVEVNRTDAALPGKLADAQAAVTAAAVASIPAAGTALTAKLLPLVDDYLAKLDRALALSDAYRAHHADIDPAVAKSLDSLHARAKTVRDARDQLAALAARASSGAIDLEGLANGLVAASVAMTRVK